MPPLVVININPSAATRSGTRALVRAFKPLVDGPVLERHFLQMTPARLAALQPRAVVIGPQGVPFDAYPEPVLDHLWCLLRGLEGPALAVCGGHQALVLAYGGKIGPVHGGVARHTYEGLTKETGLRHVVPAVPDPLLQAAGDFVVSHVEGVTELPLAFDLIGKGLPCRVQMIRLRDRPVYGVQFHPERGGNGLQLLERFVSLAAA